MWTVWNRFFFFCLALSRSSSSSPIKQLSECISRHTQHLLPGFSVWTAEMPTTNYGSFHYLQATTKFFANISNVFWEPTQSRVWSKKNIFGMMTEEQGLHVAKAKSIISKIQHPLFFNISILIRRISICYLEHARILNLMQVTWTAGTFWLDSRPFGATTKTASSSRLGKPLRRLSIAEEVTAVGLPLIINGSNIEGVGKEKFLGVHIAEDLAQKHHSSHQESPAATSQRSDFSAIHCHNILSLKQWKHACLSACISLFGM